MSCLDSCDAVSNVLILQIIECLLHFVRRVRVNLRHASAHLCNTGFPRGLQFGSLHGAWICCHDSPLIINARPIGAFSLKRYLVCRFCKSLL